MRKIILTAFIFFTVEIVVAQADSTKLLVGFPITSYMVDLNDSVKLLQIVPGGLWDIKEKQLGLVRGIYRDGKVDSATKGWGKCQLIKGDYYYFAIHTERIGSEFRAGDLLYTFMQMPGNYIGRLTKIAAHYISLQNVYEDYFFNRGDAFLDFDQQKEEVVLDSMLADIHFTGKYFAENNTGMNKKITGGKYIDKMLLETMMVVNRNDLIDFLDYMLARSYLYSGNSWKLSEIFATWLAAGAPTVVND